MVILMAGAFLGAFFGSNIMSIAVILIMVLGYFTVLQRVYHTWKSMQSEKLIIIIQFNNSMENDNP